RSNTTYENLLSLKSVVDDKQYYYLVTSYWHMPRVIKSARKIGLKICPVETPKLFSSSVIPTLEAHWKTKAAIHEWIALLWYWLSNRI
ncbi:MAG: YdcF family protein, partial [Pseudomonadales bacterium]|nr:YdcF family protein [Pseudomonadales bacterium]